VSRLSRKCGILDVSQSQRPPLPVTGLSLLLLYSCSQIAALLVLLEVEIEVTLRLTVSQSVCLGIEHPCGTCDQILLPVGVLLSEICGLISVKCSLWREDGSAICSVITQCSESRRTRNHTLLSHLRLPQPGGPGSPPRNRVAQLYPLALGSLYVVSYDSPLTTCRATVEVSNLPPTWRTRSPYISPRDSRGAPSERISIRH
jgi:hypothetical protein